MTTQPTLAILVSNSMGIIGTCKTTARNGAVVSYGTQLKDGNLLEVGRAKISRSKKYLQNDQLMYDLEMSNSEYAVNNSNYRDA